MDTIRVIKIGGNVIDDDATLKKFLKDFASVKGPKVLVHGGGKIATEISKGLGIAAQMVDGRRITDAETLRVVTMVYGGLINKKIVSLLQSYGCNAMGLTGADANVISADKRPLKNNIDYGFVGDVKSVNAETLSVLLKAGITPVMAPLTHDGNGNMLNTNADTIASTVAVGISKLNPSELIYCFELPGVMRDINDKDSVINQIDGALYQQLKEEGVVAKGMIPKMDNSFDAIKAGAESVTICHADDLLAILNLNERKGTKLVLK
ncbi:acetylglutamate kinase [Cytophagaceae bacterium ABcell3]|nr:acetylglutamate kinase [Cytophagaceae bacterium ABcell3]